MKTTTPPPIKTRFVGARLTHHDWAQLRRFLELRGETFTAWLTATIRALPQPEADAPRQAPSHTWRP